MLTRYSLAFLGLMVLLLAVIDVGVNVGNRSEVAHAAREAALYDPARLDRDQAECTVFGHVDRSARGLVCFAKARAHMSDAKVRVRLSTEGDRRVVCVMGEAYSPTGLFAFAVQGRAFTSRSLGPKSSAAPRLVASETPLPGATWDFCPRGM